MPYRLILTAVALLFISPLVGKPGAAAQRGGRGNDVPDTRPIPRNAEGRVLLGGETPDVKGLWTGRIGLGTPIAPADEIPFQPWARALFDERQLHELEPHARCKPSSVTRPFETPYGTEILEIPDLQRIYIFDVGGPHTFRTIYMDGRTHPQDLEPSYLGHSIGWWEGDTLVVETVGFNEGTWLDRRGIPYTEAMRTLERLTRTAYNIIDYEVTIDDPDVYTAPWTGGFPIRWGDGSELWEYVCQQGNQANTLMLGEYDSVDRTTTIVP